MSEPQEEEPIYYEAVYQDDKTLYEFSIWGYRTTVFPVSISYYPNPVALQDPITLNIMYIQPIRGVPNE